MIPKCNNDQYDLRNNLFVLSCSNNHKIIYAPLQGYSFFCTKTDAKEISSYIKHGTPVADKQVEQYLTTIRNTEIEIPYTPPTFMKPNKLLIILSQQCNMACSYCYAHESRSKAKININSVFACIDYIISYDTSTLKTFTFIGGGEPFVTWDLLIMAIEYIEKRTTEEKIQYQIRIVTNGTLLSHERVQWLSGKQVVISLSFDVLPDVQEKQRPLPFGISSYKKTVEGINQLRSSNIPFIFRSTITPLNVDRMKEMAQVIYKDYPEIRRLHFEPVTDDSIDNKLFFEKYINSFFETLEFCEDKNLYLTNSYIASFEHIKYNMCQSEMCITPDNTIVACHRHSSSDDPYYKMMKYGSIEEGKIEFNQNEINDVLSIRSHKFEKCGHCFAKWHCAGGCASKRLVYSKNNVYLHCSFIKAILSKYIEYKLLKTKI